MKIVHPNGLPTPQRYWSMLAIALGIAMAVLDSAVANVALPTIAHDLHATPAASIWIVNAYQLVIVATLIPLASLGERVGYRRVYQIGLAIFVLGSLACALSHTLTTLVLSRIAQGVGGAGIMAMNGALVRFTYPHRLLGRGVGLNALVVSIAAAIGPTVASAILAVGTWEWLFAINVPIGIVNLVLAARALPWSDLSERPFDWRSAVLTALVLGLVFVGADFFAHGGEGLYVALGALAVAIAAGWLLARRELAVERPLVPVDLLRLPVFALSVLTSICSFAAYMIAYLVMPFYFETALHRDQVATGLLMTPWPVALGLVAPLAGWLSDKLPAAILGGAGLAVLAAGLSLLVAMPHDASSADIAWRMALCGVGFGFFQAPNNRILLASAPRERAGAAGGMLATARLLGQTSGATTTALVFRLAPQEAQPVGLSIGIGCAVLAAIASLVRLGGGRSRAAARQTEERDAAT